MTKTSIFVERLCDNVIMIFLYVMQYWCIFAAGGCLGFLAARGFDKWVFIGMLVAFAGFILDKVYLYFIKKVQKDEMAER